MVEEKHICLVHLVVIGSFESFPGLCVLFLLRQKIWESWPDNFLYSSYPVMSELSRLQYPMTNRIHFPSYLIFFSFTPSPTRPARRPTHTHTHNRTLTLTLTLTLILTHTHEHTHTHTHTSKQTHPHIHSVQFQRGAPRCGEPVHLGRLGSLPSRGLQWDDWGLGRIGRHKYGKHV